MPEPALPAEKRPGQRGVKVTPPRTRSEAPRQPGMVSTAAVAKGVTSLEPMPKLACALIVDNGEASDGARVRVDAEVGGRTASRTVQIQQP